MSPTIWTIGHSTHTIGEFIELLAAYRIELVADVRRFPASRRLPHFESSALEQHLAAADIAYRWFPSLGGRRRTGTDSANDGWRHPAFRAYADHAETEEFAEGLFELLLCAEGLRTAIMCAEVLWWRCHRRIIADVLTAVGVEVVHIRTADSAEVHVLAPPAHLEHGRITWAASPRSEDT